MKRLVSQKIRAIASPGLTANSCVHQQCIQIRVIHQVLDLRCARERTTCNRLLNLASRQLAIDASSVPEKPNPCPFHRICERELRGGFEFFSLMALDSTP